LCRSSYLPEALYVSKGFIFNVYPGKYDTEDIYAKISPPEFDKYYIVFYKELDFRNASEKDWYSEEGYRGKENKI